MRIDKKKAQFIAIPIMALAFWLLVLRPTSYFGLGPRRNALPTDALWLLKSGDQFELLSLNPRPIEPNDRTPQSLFHGYEVLGRAKITDRKIRNEILAALTSGISESNGQAAACFNPRHGLIAELSDEKVEIVICFECQSMRIYLESGALTSGSPTNTFNRALSTLGIPVAKLAP